MKHVSGHFLSQSFNETVCGSETDEQQMKNELKLR